ncbi:acyl-CoA dehydrogenase family protein [Microbacterium sp. NC79]|uniref:acyl-CoA dehydrogenase family protein n=1 Tax=Microbacterium sp. NC79 TaxID=2851009 RepID=UPI001C2C30D4|nr:acyl-CoA dehydrogenase family protein [Microbacterium sp. NC79]MBV0896128.1 acyl-CoA dehydrogenase family protein [Microbacterium sp. NC79]
MTDKFLDVERDSWEPVLLDPPAPEGGMWGELTAEQDEIRRRAREVAVTHLRPWAAHWDETEEFPFRSLDAVKDAGLLDLCIPEEYGGQGKSLLEGCIVVEELARVCLSSAMAVQPYLNGPWRAIHELGSDEMRARLLPGVADGSRHFAIGMSEPGAGSAGTDLRTEIRKDGDGYRLSGFKSWMTGGSVADTIIVFGRAPGSQGPYGIGAVVVNGRPEGMSEPHVDAKMGIRGVAECSVRFEDVWIPAEDVLIEPIADSKQGAQILVNQFNPERCGNAAMCVGLAQGALDATAGYLRTRQQFGRHLYEFQGLQWRVADMALDIELGRVMMWRAARSGTAGFPDAWQTMLAKLHTSEMVQRVTNQAIQTLGARGYSRRWPVERMFRDGRGLAIGGGTVEVMRNMLAGMVLGTRVSQRRG